METITDYHRIAECPSCETYWRRSGRRVVGFVDYTTNDTCPSCQAS